MCNNTEINEALLKKGEIWLPVVGYEDTHEVSNLGRVRRIMLYGKPVCRILTHSVGPTGYHRVMLSDGERTNIRQVHRVVADAFIPNPMNLPQVNHKNGDKGDNCITNLEWVTAKENITHSIKSGLRKPGDKRIDIVIRREMLIEIEALRRIGLTYSQIGEIIGATPINVAVRYRRRDYKHYYSDREFESLVNEYLNRNEDKFTRVDKRKFLKGGVKKRVIQIDRQGKIVGRFDSETEAAKSLGVCTSAIGHNLHGKSKYCMGYKYVYE